MIKIKKEEASLLYKFLKFVSNLLGIITTVVRMLLRYQSVLYNIPDI